MSEQALERSEARTAFPIKALVLGLTFTLLLLVGVGLHIWTSYQDLQAAQDRDVRLQELTGTITYLDEVLTMSARMAAATGDSTWEQRYRSFEPQLDAVIQQAKALSPDAYAGGAAVQTDAANVALVEMEHRSFELNAGGDHQAAAALLASPAYEEQKALYAEGNQQIIASSKENGRNAVHSAQIQWIVALLAVAAPILVAVWVTVVVATSRHASARERAENALRDSERRSRWLIENAPDALVIADDDGRVIIVNKRLQELFGYQGDELIGKRIEVLLPERFRERHVAHRGTYRARPQSRPMGSRLDNLVGLHKNGSELPVEISLSGLPGSSGLLIMAAIRDVTERTQAEEALRESEERYRTLANVAPVGIFRTDVEGKGIFSNERNVEIFGAPLEETLGFGWVGKLPPEERERVIARWKAWPKDKPVRIEQRFLRPDGSPVWVLVNIAPETTAAGQFVGLVGVVTDITERKHMEEALREQARRDSLTGVLNHAAIVEELRNVLAREGETPCAVAMVDVDGMKATNDTYGHQVGDDVLQAVAGALGREGTLLGRYGGDEFVAIIDGADRAAALRYRDEVNAALAETAIVDPDSGLRVPVSVSMGLAIHPEEAQTVADLLKLSDNAMYASRLRRPVAHNVKGMPRRRDEQAARVVSEMLPLLTSEGDLDQKLRLVAHRLSVGAGYDGVNFELIDPETKGLLLSSTFAQIPPEQAENWEQHERQQGSHSLVPIVERTRRPLIINSAADERLSEAEREMLDRGGLRSLLVAPMIWQDHMVGAMTVLSKKEAAFGPRDAQFITAVATQVTAIVRMSLMLDQVQSATDRLVRTHEETVLLLAAAGEAHDQTNGHFRHVRILSEALARELGRDEDHARELGLAAALHDIGKIHVPESVLANTGELSLEEWRLMKQHTVWGGEFFAGRPGFELAADVARCHHEHWDGTGYPDGLAGDAIPEAATIVAVADAFDAMVSTRPYSRALPVAAAIQEIAACSGKQFSPRVVQAFVRLYERGELPDEAKLDEAA